LLISKKSDDRDLISLWSWFQETNCSSSG